MNLINLNSENLVVDWLSFNLEGLMDPIIIANVSKIEFQGSKKNIKFLSVNIREKKLLGWNSDYFLCRKRSLFL